MTSRERNRSEGVAHFLRRQIARLAQSPRHAVLLVFLLSLAGSAIVGLTQGIPRPWVHDEFSYLLGADTFARGRLANPPHPHWQHFESIHIIQQPSYATKYQPAHSLILAVGQRIAGQPVAGVWLGVALMSAAVMWMLLAWLPPRWALLGGILTVLQFGVAGIWAQSYWGGAIPATGGALLFGAIRRIRDSGTARDAGVLGVAIVLLMASRPFEGLFVSGVGVASVLVGRTRRWPLRNLFVPLAVIGTIGIALAAAYNRAVTGEFSKLPYTEHSEQYDAAPLFVFQALPPEPDYRHERLREFHVGWERPFYEEQRTLDGWMTWAAARPIRAGMSYLFGPPRLLYPLGLWVPGILVLPLLMLPYLARRRWPRFALAVTAGLFTALSVVTYFMPHYVAVICGPWIFLAVESVRMLRVAARRRVWARWVVPAVLLLAAVHVGLAMSFQSRTNSTVTGWAREREQIASRLSEAGERHLVLVRYAEASGWDEWVYNSAEIDEQTVIWARDMGDAANAGLLRYFDDRNVWLLRVERSTQTIEEVRGTPPASGLRAIPRSDRRTPSVGRSASP
jgi:hypothetical protein